MLVDFTPIKMPDLLRLVRAYLLDSYNIDNLASFFELFLRDEDFELIITNTNKYTLEYPTHYLGASKREFKPTSCAEIKVYFAILIFIGIYRYKNPKSY